MEGVGGGGGGKAELGRSRFASTRHPASTGKCHPLPAHRWVVAVGLGPLGALQRKGGRCGAAALPSRRPRLSPRHHGPAGSVPASAAAAAGRRRRPSGQGPKTWRRALGRGHVYARSAQPVTGRRRAVRRAGGGGRGLVTRARRLRLGRPMPGPWASLPWHCLSAATLRAAGRQSGQARQLGRSAPPPRARVPP